MTKRNPDALQKIIDTDAAPSTAPPLTEQTATQKWIDDDRAPPPAEPDEVYRSREEDIHGRDAFAGDNSPEPPPAEPTDAQDAEDSPSDEWLLDKLCDGDPVALVKVPRAVLRVLRSRIAALSAKVAELEKSHDGWTNDAHTYCKNAAYWQEQAQASAKDAARYRWLRVALDDDVDYGLWEHKKHCDYGMKTGTRLDAAIDASLSAGATPGAKP